MCQDGMRCTRAVESYRFYLTVLSFPEAQQSWPQHYSCSGISEAELQMCTQLAVLRFAKIANLPGPLHET